MNKKPGRLENLLSRNEKATLNLGLVTADELKRMARFWFGTTAANKMRKAELLTGIAAVFKDKTRLEEGVRSLSDQERQILAVFRRYGGALSGPLLMCEALQRGLHDKTVERRGFYDPTKATNPVEQLGTKLFLLTRDGGVYGGRSYYGYGYHHSFPDLVLQPIVRDLIKPADALPWKSSGLKSEPTTTQRRAPAQVALDLCDLAQALARGGSWMTNRGGSLAKSVQNRLKKTIPGGDNDPMRPPAVESLYYEILRGLGAIEADTDGGVINLAVVQSNLRQPDVVQCWHWARSWITARLWQDGIGVVPERTNRQDSARIEPKTMQTAREVLTWALCRVATGKNEWLDLEAFLGDLWSATGEDIIQFYWNEYVWRPDFASAKSKQEITGDKARRRAYWLDREGTWAANAILGTLYYLGLVERGRYGSRNQEHHCFRLTDAGIAVFGAPEVQAAESPHDPHFLTVQPNHEVIAYLDAADASEVWPLAQMARRVSSTSGFVQSFTLTRDSIYQALKSGLQLSEIQRFLIEHSKTGLPANVAHSLVEWGTRRESLVLRTGVSLGISTAEADGAFQSLPRARWVGNNFILLPGSAGRGQKLQRVVNHGGAPARTWRVDEHGKVILIGEVDSVTPARLGQFADPGDPDWQISSASVRRARDRGIPAEQILGWLAEHLTDELPPVLETAIRNWSSPACVFLGNLLMLRIAQPQACAAVLASQRLRPVLLEHVPPNWFIIREERRTELEQLLTEIGYSIDDSYHPQSSESR